MKITYFIFIISVFMGIKGYAQTELKLYTTYFERLGVGVEYFANQHIGIGLGCSYWQKATSVFYINADVKNKLGNFYMNGMIKRYSAKNLNNAGFFYGGYIRYWMSFATITGEDLWTIEQKVHAENTNSWRTTRSHKISLGGLIGYKTDFDKKWSVGFTFGLGTSIHPSYWENKTLYDYSVITSSPVKGKYLQNLGLISMFGQISVNYRFGQP